MLAKLSSKNQLTLPTELLRQVPRADYFEAEVERGTIVLRPVRPVPVVDLETIRDQIAAAGLEEGDVDQAVTWARTSK